MPYPPNYGGVIDVFYRIKALAQLGVKIHLHCFEYNRPAKAELNEYCAKVSVYQRKTGYLPHVGLRPYIVQSRRNPTLLTALQADHAPILFEGIHCTGYLDHPKLNARKKIVRAHNIEWQYYRNLQQLERAFIPKMYAALEWRKLIRWDHKLKLADHLLTISERDESHYRQVHSNTLLVYPFHGNLAVDFTSVDENYVLFHGDLSIGDNVAVAQFLIDQFSGKAYPLILAGRSPKKALFNRVEQEPNVRLIANPDGPSMIQLIRKAKIN
ncbi:MAG: glycosyltransferase family 1 protein, partial [Bacteroidota bacterium]